MENQATPASGKMERKAPELYVRNMSLPLSYFEIAMLRDALGSEMLHLQSMIDKVESDVLKFDLLEMKLRRAELQQRLISIMPY